MQINLFDDELSTEPIPVKTEAPITKTVPQKLPVIPKKEWSPNYAINYLKKQAYGFWDMRAWENKNWDHLMVVLEKIAKEDKHNSHTFTNDGHAEYCIRDLVDHGYPLSDIANWLMSNPNSSFLHRKALCWKHPEQCPYHVYYGNYSDCNCDRRCNKGEIIGDEELCQNPKQ
jgi:hypothetical protein